MIILHYASGGGGGLSVNGVLMSLRKLQFDLWQIVIQLTLTTK